MYSDFGEGGFDDGFGRNDGGLGDFDFGNATVAPRVTSNGVPPSSSLEKKNETMPFGGDDTHWQITNGVKTNYHTGHPTTKYEPSANFGVDRNPGIFNENHKQVVNSDSDDIHFEFGAGEVSCGKPSEEAIFGVGGSDMKKHNGEKVLPIEETASFASATSSLSQKIPTTVSGMESSARAAANSLSFIDCSPFQNDPKRIPTSCSFPNDVIDDSILREWIEKHSKELKNKMADEEGMRENQRKVATEELRQFYESRDQSIATRKAENRKEEERIIQLMSHPVPDGEANRSASWKRVANLIDFNRESHTRDTSKMKDLIMELQSTDH